MPARSCVVDGEAIACDANGLSVFDLLRYRRQDDAVTLCAFDLLELDGVDLRREPIEVRKRTLKGLLRREHRGIAFNRHFDVEGSIVYRHACVLGCEGIVSKRVGSPYRPGRSDNWLKIKNPAAPASAVLRKKTGSKIGDHRDWFANDTHKPTMRQGARHLCVGSNCSRSIRYPQMRNWLTCTLFSKLPALATSTPHLPNDTSYRQTK